MNTLTFICRFNRDLQCKFWVTDKLPPAGASPDFKGNWIGKPGRENLYDYRMWVCSITQTLCEHWGAPVTIALPADVVRRPREVWTFSPGKQRKFIRMIDE